MKLYLIRHGESESNASGRYHGRNSGLSKAGHVQARKLAKRFAKIHLDLILSSDYKRAMETAEVIREIKKKKLFVTPLLGEEKYPTELTGKHKDEQDVKRIWELIRKKRNCNDWHYSDEENFFDLKKRIQKFLRFLTKREEKHILAVGHGISNRMIIALMIFGKKLTPDIFEGFLHGLLTRNTGITACEFENGKWRILTWNDHAHLG